MIVNVITRVMFMVLLTASLSINAFVFSPAWLLPPVVACLLNLRTAISMQTRSWRDFVFALAIVPAEAYMWVRIGHFLRAWTKFASNKQVDNWAAQAKAERGSGNAYLAPLIVAAAVAVALVVIWLRLPVVAQSGVLWIGWPILGVVTVLQTLIMFATLIKRHRGYRV
jgi:hypothetical protein